MKCDFCNLSAVVNFQKIWNKFIIDKNNNYKEDRNFDPLDIEEPAEDSNIYLCEKHSKQWLSGEI